MECEFKINNLLAMGTIIEYIRNLPQDNGKLKLMCPPGWYYNDRTGMFHARCRAHLNNNEKRQNDEIS